MGGSGVKVYIGEPTGKMVSYVKRKGWGAVITPFQFRNPYPFKFNFYFVDNGVYSLYLKGAEFDGELFLSTLERVRKVFHPQLPDFVVLPDKVAAGEESLELSLFWHEKLKELFPEFRYALVVQDGMRVKSVENAINETRVDVLFVGGTTEWKVRTGRLWVELARSFKIKCHIGRVGTKRRVKWARLIEADSIDSALPLFSRRNLKTFERALFEPVQIPLFRETA